MDEKIELKSSNRFHYGADNGNRTRILSLGSLHSTTKLCLHTRKDLHTSLYIFMEGLVGFEPTLRELQSHALPLGYRPNISFDTLILYY